jgi:hypothetical protein
MRKLKEELNMVTMKAPEEFGDFQKGGKVIHNVICG